MADLIDRQTAIETAIEAADKWDGGYSSEREGIIRKFFDKVPAAQPTCKPECKRMYSDVSDTISRQAAIDLFPNDALEWDTKGGYIAPHLARRMIEELPPVQPDHTADTGKKVDMMHEYIYKIVKDCDGVYCYIKQGEMIRCKECEHWKNEHLCERLSRFGSLETKADFYCGYAERKINERTG